MSGVRCAPSPPSPRVVIHTVATCSQNERTLVPSAHRHFRLSSMRHDNVHRRCFLWWMHAHRAALHMKSVDKNIDKRNNCQQAMIWVFSCNAIDSTVHLNGIMTRFPTRIIACCVYRCSYSALFSYPVLPRAESATFWLRLARHTDSYCTRVVFGCAGGV